MKQNAFKIIVKLLCVCFLLSGCSAAPTSSVPETEAPNASSLRFPEGEDGAARTLDAQLVLPGNAENGYVTLPVSIRETADISCADALTDALLQAFSNQELWDGQNVPVLRSVEDSGEIAAVSLDTKNSTPETRQLFVFAQCLCNTLARFQHTKSLLLLVDGHPLAVDSLQSLPAGLFTPDENTSPEEIFQKLENQSVNTAFTRKAAVYFPVSGGKGVLCEEKTVSFSSAAPVDIASALLNALTEGALRYAGLPAFPELSDFLEKEPVLENAGDFIALRFAFTDAFHQTLLNHGITRSGFTAALALTVNGFLPSIDGIALSFGGEKITSLTPEGVLNGAGETLYFPDGLIERTPFTAFLLSPVPLYFADEEGGLSLCLRAVPWQKQNQLETLLSELLAGPKFGDLTEKTLFPLIDAGGDGDILKTGFLSAHTAACNFSESFLEHLQGFDENAEKRLIYAIVNTLTEKAKVTDVAFFVNGVQKDALTGSLWMQGVFMRNPALITE